MQNRRTALFFCAREVRIKKSTDSDQSDNATSLPATSPLLHMAARMLSCLQNNNYDLGVPQGEYLGLAHGQWRNEE